MIGRRAASLAAAWAAAACAGDAAGPAPTPPTPTTPTIRVVAGAGVTDTVLARPAQALIVEVRDSLGRPATGLVVRFEAVATPVGGRAGERGVYVCALTAAQCEGSGFATDRVDEAGRAKAAIQLGTVAGRAAVAVAVPELGLRDTARFETRPGGVARVRFAVRDTAVRVGGTAALEATPRDRFANPVAATVSYHVAGDADALAVDASGTATGRAFGRGMVVASVGAVADTARVSVVPDGRIVVSANRSVVAAHLDGSAREVLASQFVGFGPYAPSWSPDGRRVVFHDAFDGARLFTAAPGEAPVALPTPGLTYAWRARYSHDGAWIYFVASSSAGSELWRIRPDGTGLESVSARATALAPGASMYYADYPSPSPDGRLLAFAAGLPYESQIQLLDLGTWAVRPLGVRGRLARWMPDGTTIVVSDGAYSPGTIRIASTAGGAVRVVGTSSRYQGEIDVSPDGRWIVATVGALNAPGMMELIEVATGRTVPLPFAAGSSYPAWRPTSR